MISIIKKLLGEQNEQYSNDNWTATWSNQWGSNPTPVNVYNSSASDNSLSTNNSNCIQTSNNGNECGISGVPIISSVSSVSSLSSASILSNPRNHLETINER